MADVMKGAAWADAEIEKKPQLRGPLEYREAVEKLWDAGLPPGDKTGWPSVDKHYTVAPGQLSVITGWPSSGKSEWLDALMMNLYRQSWKFAVFSAENMPVETHLAKLLEKLSGAPFGTGAHPRIERDSIGESLDEMNQAFMFISPRADLVSLPSIVACAEKWLLADDGRKPGIVIDPWNELDHWRDRTYSETEYISQSLSFLRNWARANQVHAWIVAHPAKQRRDDAGNLPVPTPDMISGSQNWWNKADCAITIHRDLKDLDSRVVDIYVQKIRFKHVGYPGRVILTYDRVTGRYSEPRQTALYAVAKDGE